MGPSFERTRARREVRVGRRQQRAGSLHALAEFGTRSSPRHQPLTSLCAYSSLRDDGCHGIPKTRLARPLPTRPLRRRRPRPRPSRRRLVEGHAPLPVLSFRLVLGPAGSSAPSGRRRREDRDPDPAAHQDGHGPGRRPDPGRPSPSARGQPASVLQHLQADRHVLQAARVRPSPSPLHELGRSAKKRARALAQSRARPPPSLREHNYARAVAFAGSNHRLRRFLAKLRRGEPIKVSVIGGSVSRGQGIPWAVFPQKVMYVLDGASIRLRSGFSSRRLALLCDAGTTRSSTT